MELEFRDAIRAGACKVHARWNSATEPTFTAIPADVFQKFRITDWQSGEAEAPNGENLFSIHLEPPFSDETLNAEVSNHAARLRWGLLGTLGWIATRDMKISYLVDRPSETIAGIDVLLADRAQLSEKAANKRWPFKSATGAWKGSLAPALSSGKLKAYAARTVRSWEGGSQQTELGQTFPPDEGACSGGASHYHDLNGEPTLFPKMHRARVRGQSGPASPLRQQGYNSGQTLRWIKTLLKG